MGRQNNILLSLFIMVSFCQSLYLFLSFRLTLLVHLRSFQFMGGWPNSSRVFCAFLGDGEQKVVMVWDGKGGKCLMFRSPFPVSWESWEMATGRQQVMNEDTLTQRMSSTTHWFHCLKGYSTLSRSSSHTLSHTEDVWKIAEPPKYCFSFSKQRNAENNNFFTIVDLFFPASTLKKFQGVCVSKKIFWPQIT